MTEDSANNMIKDKLGLLELIKGLLVVAGSVIEVVNVFTKLTNERHAIITTIVFAFFAAYVALDIRRWPRYWPVWAFGPPTIAVAMYWWVSSMALRGFPPQPMLPASWYPSSWSPSSMWPYCAMAAWLGLYAVWDFAAADDDYQDPRFLQACAVVLFIGVCFCLFATFRGPLVA